VYGIMAVNVESWNKLLCWDSDSCFFLMVYQWVSYDSLWHVSSLGHVGHRSVNLM
jgi:hypothetical protein